MALATFALTIGLSFITLSVSAASACKGLERGPCERKDCSWVEPYTRKDGIDVTGHCKSKPYKSAKSDDKKRLDSKSKSVRSDYKKRVDNKGKSSKSGDKKRSESKRRSGDKKKSESKKKKSEKTI